MSRPAVEALDQLVFPFVLLESSQSNLLRTRFKCTGGSDIMGMIGCRKLMMLGS